MQKVEFTKYPKVPSTTNYPLPTGPVVIQEKMDGANAGIELDPENQHCVLIHSRTRALCRLWVGGGEQLVDDIGGFAGLLTYIAPRLPQILTFLHGLKIRHIYGEWLTPHTLKYPPHMWNQFYVFDVVDMEGKYRNPEFYPEITSLEMPLVACAPLDTLPGVGPIEAFIENIKAQRVTEGVVIKSYAKDALGELDNWGQRYAYKYVLPDFKEQHQNNPLFPPRASALTLEQRLCAVMPDRSIEKVFQKVLDAKGDWKPQYFPMLLGMAWQEYLEEHAVKALQEHSFPVVNTRALKTEVERRAREFALAYRVA